jgi:hypothetical protein
MGLHEIKIFFTTKEMVTRLKREPTDSISVKGLITRMYREHNKLTPKESMAQ